MIAKTQKGKEIRKYYVKLENIYNKIIKEEIQNKNNLLEEKDKEIKQIQQERVIDKKLEKHKILLNMLKDKNCMFVDHDKDPMVVHNIQPTVVSKKAGCNVVLELNKDKSAITRHFNSVNVASQELKTNAHAVKKIIQTSKIYNDHYYIYLNDCTSELLDTYDTKVFNYVPKCAIKIKCIHPETKEEQIFPSLTHAYKFCKVHHKTVHKAINEKKLLNGYYWEFV